MAKKTPRADGYIELKKTVTYHDGSKKRMSFYGKTKKAAEKSYQQYLLKVEQFKEEKLNAPLFSAYSSKWLAIKEKSVSDKTWRGYKSKVEQFDKAFGQRRLDTIAASELQLYLAQHSHESANTVKKRLGYLKSIFDLAVSDGVISANPMKDAALPNCKAQKEHDFYTPQQTRRIVDLAKQAGISGLSAFIPLKTGMRPGEVVAFNPARDLDLSEGILTVQETVKLVNNRSVVGPPKYNSIRSLPVDEEFCQHIASFNFPGYVFVNSRRPEQPMSESKWIEFRYRKFMATLPPDLPRYTAHALRHTYGTLLYESGTDLYTIAKVMGHKDVKVTQIYVHQRIDALKQKVHLDY